MNNKIKRPKILIVYGYHPKENFAVRVGKLLLKKNQNNDIKIVRYDGGRDSKTSTYYLRKFIGLFNSAVASIVLHDTDNFADYAIVYCAGTKIKRRKGARRILNFSLECVEEGRLVAYGSFLVQNIGRGFIDIELNQKVSLRKSATLVADFSKYLIDLKFKF